MESVITHSIHTVLMPIICLVVCDDSDSPFKPLLTLKKKKELNSQFDIKET